MENFKKPKLRDRDNDLTKQWFVEYFYKHPETGKFTGFRTWISMRLKTGVARRKKADQIIQHLTDWLLEGNSPFDHEDNSRQPALKALDDLLEIKSGSYRKRTVHTYRNLINVFRAFTAHKKLKNIEINNVSKNIAQQFSDYLIQQKKYKNRTHNYAIMHMKGLWNMLIKRYNIRINPWLGIEPLPVEETSLVTFTSHELTQIREELPKDDFKLWLCAGLVYYCALRPAEIMRLKPHNIRVDHGALYLGGNITKNRKSKWVEIPSDTFLEDLKKLEADKLNPDWFVFSRHLEPGPKEAAPTRIANRWRTWADRYGIPKNIYSLKHNAAGLMSEAGIPVRDIQLHLRHHSLEQTEYYLERFRKSVGPNFRERYPAL